MMGKWDAGPEHSSMDEIPVLVHCILKMIEALQEFSNYSTGGLLTRYSGHSLATFGFTTFIYLILCSQR